MGENRIVLKDLWDEEISQIFSKSVKLAVKRERIEKAEDLGRSAYGPLLWEIIGTRLTLWMCLKEDKTFWVLVLSGSTNNRMVNAKAPPPPSLI